MQGLHVWPAYCLLHPFQHVRGPARRQIRSLRARQTRTAPEHDAARSAAPSQRISQLLTVQLICGILPPLPAGESGTGSRADSPAPSQRYRLPSLFSARRLSRIVTRPDATGPRSARASSSHETNRRRQPALVRQVRTDVRVIRRLMVTSPSLALGMFKSTSSSPTSSPFLIQSPTLVPRFIV